MLLGVPDVAVRRIVLDRDPYAGRDPNWQRRAHWPAHWIALAGTAPLVAGYRLAFDLAKETTVQLHVSADERYELYLDGVLVQAFGWDNADDRGAGWKGIFEEAIGELRQDAARRKWGAGTLAPRIMRA